jgi:hypothetical protein
LLPLQQSSVASIVEDQKIEKGCQIDMMTSKAVHRSIMGHRP